MLAAPSVSGADRVRIFTDTKVICRQIIRRKKNENAHQSMSAFLSFVFPLDGTVYFAGSDASCAYFCFSDCTVIVDSYSLNVRIPLSSSVSVGMGYVVSGNLALSTNFALS